MYYNGIYACSILIAIFSVMSTATVTTTMTTVVATTTVTATVTTVIATSMATTTVTTDISSMTSAISMLIDNDCVMAGLDKTTLMHHGLLHNNAAMVAPLDDSWPHVTTHRHHRLRDNHHRVRLLNNHRLLLVHYLRLNMHLLLLWVIHWLSVR